MKNYRSQKQNPEIEPPPTIEPSKVPPEIIPKPEKNEPYHPSPEIKPPEILPEIEPDKEQ